MPEGFDWLAALLALTALEIVLGVDNIVFIAIVTSHLKGKQRMLARRIGLLAAMLMRVIMLLLLGWILALETPLITVWDYEFSGKDLLMLVGGLFLLAKGTAEIHKKLEGEEETDESVAKKTMTMAIVQIAAMDAVFSIDSVLTAIGMADEIWVMITAVVIAIGIMMISARPVTNFVEHHPTVRMLALSFLLLIGVSLFAEGFHAPIHKGYIYFAMGFSLFVEVLNLRMRKARKPVRMHGRRMPETE